MKHVYTTKLAIRWGDIDQLGHVNNAKYFTYSEQARIEWCDTLGVLGGPTGPILAAIDSTFLKPIFYPATIEIKLLAGDRGHTSFRLKHEFYIDGVLTSHGVAVIVWVDYTKGKPIPLPQAIADLVPKKES